MQPPYGSGCTVQTEIGCYRRGLSDGGSDWYWTGAVAFGFNATLTGLQSCTPDAPQVTTMEFCPADAGVD